jgi:ribokinase
MCQIVVIGSSNTDLVARVPRIPAPGETVSGGQFTIAGGGKGANQAVSAARLGADVIFVARIGDDLFGRRMLDALRQEALDLSYVAVDPEVASGVALIVVDASGENSIAVAPGANDRLSPADVHRARSTVESAQVVLLQLEAPVETVRAAVELAHAAGVRVILNPAPAPPPGALDDILPQVDVLTPNEGEVEALAGTEGDVVAAARNLVARGVPAVVVTLGAGGALIATGDDTIHVPAFSVEAVDTTGAGDAFSGGLAVALAQGRSLAEAVRFGNACGALAATRPGAQPSLPTAAEVQRFLDRRAVSGPKSDEERTTP